MPSLKRLERSPLRKPSLVRAGSFILCWIPVSSLLAQAESPDLTFFGWSDQHVQTDGNGDHLLPAIDAMNSLPGTKFPEAMGGEVGVPAFVFGCGDITEWPSRAAIERYDGVGYQAPEVPRPTT